MDRFVAEPVMGRAFARPVGSLAQTLAFVAGNDGSYRFAALLCKAFRAIQLERPGPQVHMTAAIHF
jgi:hypothetical protein